LPFERRIGGHPGAAPIVISLGEHELL